VTADAADANLMLHQAAAAAAASMSVRIAATELNRTELASYGSVQFRRSDVNRILKTTSSRML